VLLANTVNKELKMEGGRVSGLASQQDGGQFEDALRRLHALEKKLTDQVQVDITELRSKWVQPRVERVTNNTFKLWQVRENLKLSKVLYVEEERLLGEFKKVKDALITASMDDEYFEATKDTCVFLGGKLTEVRNKQLLCYSASRDLETAVNKDIMTIRFEDKDYADLDLEQVRASTPLREMEPTPLDRHRSKSREPSPLAFTMPPMRLSSGTTTPGGSSTVGDPHAYFSRPGSSQSMYGGRGPTTDRERKQDEEFRAKLAAMQADDDSPPSGRRLGVPSQGIVCRSASGKVIKDDPVDFATMEPRPGSAMSECSIQLPGDVSQCHSRPGSRMDQMLGDELSRSLLDLTTSGNLRASPAHNASYSAAGFPQGKNMLDDLDVEINLGEEAATKREEEAEASRKAAEAAAEKIRADAKRMHEEKEKERKEAEAAKKKEEAAAKAEKLRLEKEAEAKEREEKKKADEKKMADLAEKRRLAAEKKAEEEAKKKEEEAKKKEEEKQKKLEAKAKKEAEEKKKEEERLAKEAEKKAKLEEKQRKMEEAKEKKRLEEEKKMEDENRAMEEALKIEMQKAKEEAESLKEAEAAKKREEAAEKAEKLRLEKEADAKKQEEKKKSATVAEKKSLQKDVADLETVLQQESVGAGSQQSEAGKKSSASQKDGKQTPVEETVEEKKRPPSRGGKKETEAPAEEKGKDTSKTAKQDAAKESAPQKPPSRWGKKSESGPEQKKPSTEEKRMPEQPTSKSSLSQTEKKESGSTVEAALKGTNGASKAVPGETTCLSSDADDEGDLIVEKPRSKSRSASRTRTAKAVEEEESEKEEQPRKRSLSRGRPQKDEAKDAKPKPASRSSSKPGGKEEAAVKEAKPVSRSNSKAGEKEEIAAKKKEEAGAAFVKSLKSRSSSRGGQAEEEEEAVLMTPKEPTSRPAGNRKKSESERKISESEQTGQTGSRHASRGGSPVGILKGGKRSRDASKDRGGGEVASKDRNLSKDKLTTLDLSQDPAEEVPVPGKPVSRSASLKKSISFSKRTQEFDDAIEEKFVRAGQEPLQSAKDIFAAIADTSLESGLAKSRSGSKERPGSRTSSSGFPQAEPREMPEMEYDDEDELMIILDDVEMQKSGRNEAEPELEVLKSRSQSRERPGSRGSQTSQSSRQGVLKSRSASNVPELEAVEVPDSLKTMIEGLRKMEEEGDDEVDLARPRSGAREPKEEFPRPMSQARPISAASTGFSHLDEFERKLAEMESELDHEVEESKAEGRPGSALRRGGGEWDLSPTVARAGDETFQEVAQDFKDTFAMNITKLAQERGEAIYATVKKKKSERTDDGFYINQEEELGGVDHSMIQDGEFIQDAVSEYDAGSEYVFDEITGEQVRRSKKVSFAASEERWEIQRETQLSGLGRMKEMLTLSGPKAMKPLPGKEPREDSAQPESRGSRRSGSRSKEPSPSPANFLHAMTGGLIGSQSPTLSRREGSNSSIFGSLLRKGRKGSRSGSQQGSRDSSGDRGSETGDFEDGRGSSLRSDLGSDAGSTGSLVMRIKDKVRRKKPKVQPADFDELFARGLALSAQLESEQNKDPFGPKAVDLGRQMMEVGAATAAAGGDTNAISVALNDGVSGVTGVRIAGYQEKVNAYLDEQAQTPGATLNMAEEPKERGRRRHRREPKPKVDATAPSGEQTARSQSDEKRKTSREYTKPEDIQLSPRPRRNLFTGEVLAGELLPPGSPDAQFLAKVSEFVSKNEADLSLPNSSSKLAANPSPTVPVPTDLLGVLAPPAGPRLTPSPGRSFLDSTGGFEVFGPSVERDNPPAESNKDGAMSNEGYQPSNLTMSKFAAAAKDAAIKLTSQSPPPTESVIQQRGAVVAGGVPGPDEPGDKGIPAQLKPDKLMANEEFYEKLRTGLKTALTPERGFDTTQEDPGGYQKYSHHLGRAEFGTLKRPSVAPSRDDSGERANQGRIISRNTSSDKINERMAGSRKVSRQNSGTHLDRGVRSDSRASDYSIALPDLEIDPDAQMEIEREIVGAPVLRTMSDNVNDPPPLPKPDVASQDVLVRKEEVLKDMELHRQKIQEAKAWIQNGLMTVVGVGVMAYLQTLEQMGGAT